MVARMVAACGRITLAAFQLRKGGTMKHLLATSLFTTAAYIFTLLAGQPVANAAAAPGGVVTTPPSAVLSPATDALTMATTSERVSSRPRSLTGSS